MHSGNDGARRVGGANGVGNGQTPSGGFFFGDRRREIVTFVAEVPGINRSAVAEAGNESANKPLLEQQGDGIGQQVFAV